MDARSYWGRIREPLEYRYPVGKRLLSMVFLPGWIYCFTQTYFGERSNSALPPTESEVVFGVLFAVTVGFGVGFLSLFLLLSFWRAMIRITSDGVEYRSAFRSVHIHRMDVIGKQRLAGEDGRQIFRIYSRLGTKMSLDPESFDADYPFFQWITSLPDAQPELVPSDSRQSLALRVFRRLKKWLDLVEIEIG